ncbi:hypothetical protein Sjap_000917 [Stephania japonica]|uniref:F-box associated beta-propeller type 3 domain-containing protein n=1 Tax=Stephania japonica TaxID=461633 RepID=A0AAP0KLA7_9MAGN
MEEEKQKQQSRELPTDLIFEQILSRLPIDNLYPLCRSVCKEWQDFMWGWRFRHLNNERTEQYFYLSYQKLCSCHNNGSPYTLKVIRYDYPPSNPSIPSIPCPYFPTTKDEYDYNSYIIFSTSSFNTSVGIYCLSDDPDSVLNPRYFICKSDTRQEIQLPEPDHTSQTVAMEIMVVQYKSSAGFLHYKVLRVSKPQGPSEKKIQYCFELFDSEAGDSSWKEVGCVKLPCGQIHRGQAVLVDATFHWLFKTLENNYRFLAFNMEIDESLGRHNVDRYNMPKKVNDDAIHAGSGKSCCKLMDYKGKLGLIHHVIGKASCMSLEIWVMAHYVKKEAVWNMVKSYIEPVDSPFWVSPPLLPFQDWLFGTNRDLQMVGIHYDSRKISEGAKLKVNCPRAQYLVFPFQTDKKEISNFPKPFTDETTSAET